MRFRIIKKVDNTGTWYWTIPKNILTYLWCILSNLIIYCDTQSPWDCWYTLEEAKQHIQRWNTGYYKKKYCEEEIKQD